LTKNYDNLLAIGETMIKIEELLKDKKLKDLSVEQQTNLKDLVVRLNKLRAAFGRPMNVTSGVRSLEDHLRIYADKGIRDLKLIPMKSKHLSGQACDFADPDNTLKSFLNSCTPEQLEEFGLWYEDFVATVGWLHCQSVPPKSGKRFFKP
jgi:uncharacterized protein YcbK (DUF882 family)